MTLRSVSFISAPIKTLGEVGPTTREQRCWVHKTANVLNKLPKRQNRKPSAETKEALVAFNALSDPGDWVTRLLRRVVSGHFDDPMPFG